MNRLRKRRENYEGRYVHTHTHIYIYYIYIYIYICVCVCDFLRIDNNNKVQMS